ncbi:tripartite tricarboxylate transporter TctB family protein [Geminicoccaceae bacterium 1502E]|nr:tripartite tricarboxylate transporter TctB family protein [Geminicoccaceae bacterium 1502E]
MNREQRHWSICLGVMMLALGGVLGYASARIPAGVFDPIGSGSFPLFLSILLMVLAAGTILQAVASQGPPAAQEAPPPGKAGVRAARLLALAALTMAYCASIASALLPFEVSTFLFVLAVGSLLQRRVLRASEVLRLGLLGLVVGIAVKAVFTRILYLNLP